MRYESGEVVLWFVNGRWLWELYVNGDLAAASVVYDHDEKTAREIAKWVAGSLDVDYREATPRDAERRKVQDRLERMEADRALVAGRGLGVVRPGEKSKPDLIDVIVDHEAEHPFTDDQR